MTTPPRQGKMWFVERLQKYSGGPEQTAVDGVLESKTRRRNVAHRWQPLATQVAGQTAPTTFSNSADADSSRLRVSAAGQIVRQQFNEMGKIIQRGDDATGTRYEYNELGQRTRMLMGDGKEWTWTYDEHGRRLQAIDADGDVQQWSYDARGFPAGSVAYGRIATITCDDWGRVTRIETAPQSNPEAIRTLEWEFDGRGRVVRMREQPASPTEPQRTWRCDWEGSVVMVRVQA